MNRVRPYAVRPCLPCRDMTVDPAVVLAAIGVVGSAIGLIYRDMKGDRDYWRNLAVELLKVNEKAIAVAEKVKRG